MKRVMKLFLYILALAISLPVIILVYFNVFAFKSGGQLFALIPGKLGNFAREIYYRMLLKRIGKNFRIDFGAYIVYKDVEIGDNVAIEEYSIISLCSLGNDVIMGAHVSIMSGGNHHPLDNLEITFREVTNPLTRVIVGDNVWIGQGTILLNDVASGTCVAAGSVITKKFDKNQIIGGVPGRVIRNRGEERL